MVWHYQKKAIHSRHPRNLAEEGQFCEEEGDKIVSDCFAHLICNFRRHLVKVNRAYGVSTPIECKGVLTYASLSCGCLHFMVNKSRVK